VAKALPLRPAYNLSCLHLPYDLSHLRLGRTSHTAFLPRGIMNVDVSLRIQRKWRPPAPSVWLFSDGTVLSDATARIPHRPQP
jgi:hypothetical protein